MHKMNRRLMVLSCFLFLVGTGQAPNTVQFSWTVNADTSSITNPSPGMFQVPAITNSLTLVGDKTTGIENVTVYLNTSTGTVTFGSIPGGGIGLTSSSLTTWNLASPIGALNGPNVVVDGTITESSDNAITLSGVASPGNNPSPSFQAALSVPTITGVSNAASNNVQALPNGGVTQGAIFVLYGIDLGPASFSFAPAAFQTTNLSGTTVAVMPANGASAVCTAPASAGSFTVPPYVLEALPTANAGFVFGSISESSFTATGIDVGIVGIYTNDAGFRQRLGLWRLHAEVGAASQNSPPFS